MGLITDWTTATRWATTLGQTLAIGLGLFGLLAGQVTLVVVTALVFFAAGATHAEERGHGVLASERVGDACNRHAIALTERDRLSTVVRYVLTSYQPDFAVMRGGTLLGVVLRGDVLAILAQRTGDHPVTAFMSSCPRVAAGLSLADVRAVLDEHGASVAAVYDDRGFVGLVGREDIREAEVFLSFVRATPSSHGLPPVHADRVQVGA